MDGAAAARHGATTSEPYTQSPVTDAAHYDMIDRPPPCDYLSAEPSKPPAAADDDDKVPQTTHCVYSSFLLGSGTGKGGYHSRER